MYCRRSIVILLLLLLGSFAHGSPCSQVKSSPDIWVKSKVDLLVHAAYAAYQHDGDSPVYNKVLGSIDLVMVQCRLTQDKDFVNRYKEFVDYVTEASFAVKPDHLLGFNVPDKEYFAETKQYLQIPDFLRTRKFLRDVSRYETLKQAVAYLRSLNVDRPTADKLIYLSYTSQHLGTPDNDDSFRRLLIVVPGNAVLGIPDKWVQFGVTDPGKRVRIRNVSVVSALPGAGETYDTYFKDYFRTYRPDGSISIKGRWELGEGDESCVLCHKSGVLPIFPKPGSVSVSDQRALRDINERFRTYGKPRFGGYLDASKLGPGISFASEEDRARRFGENFEDTVVSHAMSCAACHKSDGLGSLNWPMDRVLITSFVKGGEMPLGFELSSGHRSELYNKLVAEYFATDDAKPGILKSWLMGWLRQQ